MKSVTQFLFALAIVVLTALPSEAAFPGKNGRISFVDGPDVFTMNPDGSDVRQLTSITGDNSAFFANWSPDGKFLVFFEVPGPDYLGQLWMMKADGSDLHRVFSDDAGFDDEAPSFSPDGKHIVFTRCGAIGTEFNCSIYRIKSDGTGLTAITPLVIESSDFAPVYAPDGSKIVFEGYGRNGILGALYTVNPDGSDIRQLTASAIGGYRADWSPDSQKLVFSSHCCNPPPPFLYSIGRNGGAIKHLTNNGGLYWELAPAWSPQGDAIVFWTLSTIDGSYAIWTITANGTDAKLLRTVRPSRLPQSPFRKALSKRAHGLGRRARAQPTPHEIEEGGQYPRWGVAQ